MDSEFFRAGKRGKLHHEMMSSILIMSHALSARAQVEIHQKIVKDASRRVRTEGITGAAVSAVMRDAGLTPEAFTSISKTRTNYSSSRWARISRK
jgi:hypothetical protein